MTNLNSKLRGLFGKTIITGVVTLALAVATFAQSGTLFYAGTNTRYGTIQAFPNVWRIVPDAGGEVKIYSCRDIGGGGLGCVFTQFGRDGRTQYSGDAQVFQNGAVNMQYKFDFTSGFQHDTSGEVRLQVK